MLCTIAISLTIVINWLVKAKNVISSAYCNEQNATCHGRIVSCDKTIGYSSSALTTSSSDGVDPEVHTDDQMQLDKIIALEKEELCTTRHINSDLKDEIRQQQSDLLSIERIEKQSIKHELANKMRTNDTLQVKLDDMHMKDLMDQK